MGTLLEPKQTTATKVVQVADIELVAALSAVGMDMPERYTTYASEDIAEDVLDEVINNSVYVYPYTPELLLALQKLKDNETKQPRGYDDKLDQAKQYFGIGQ